MFSHIFENSVNNLLSPERMIYQEAPGKAPRPGISAYFTPKTPENKPEIEADSVPKEDVDKTKDVDKKVEEIVKDKKGKLKKLKEGVSKSLFENPAEHKKIKEAIDKLTPQQLREYYDVHEPEKYNGRLWTAWNMDFVKNVMLIKDATPLIARKYAWVFQEWLKDKGFNPGVDGRIGKKTTEALGRYLCSIGGNDDICKKIGGKPGEGEEVKEGEIPFEFTKEQWGKIKGYYWPYIKILDITGGINELNAHPQTSQRFAREFLKVIESLEKIGQLPPDAGNLDHWKNAFNQLRSANLVSEKELGIIYPYSVEEFWDQKSYLDELGKVKETQKTEEEVRSEPAKEIPKDYRDKINKRENGAEKQLSTYMLNSVPGMVNKLKEFSKHDEKIQDIKSKYNADINKFKSDAIAKETLYADRAVGVGEAHDNFLTEYKAWKKEKLSYDEDIKGTETEKTDIGRKRKEKLKNAEDAKNHEYSILKKAVQTYYSELARLTEKRWDDYEKRMRDEISRYDFPADEKVDIGNISNVSYKEYGGGTRADTDVTLATTNYAEAVKKHQNYLLGGISGGIEKYLWKIPQRVINKPEDIDVYIRRDGAGFERNQIAMNKLLRGRGSRGYVDTINHFIYFNNYLRVQKRASDIKNSVMRDASNGTDKVNKVELVSLLQNRNEAETRLA